MADWRALAHALRGRLERDPAACAPFGGDASVAASVTPAAVVFPSDAEDVCATLRWAHAHGVPVTPRGGGTGKAGGAVPRADGVVIALGGLDAIEQIRPADGYAEVQPGVITGDFRQAVDERGLFWPVDPGALDRCTLGGNAATNAGGPVALRYGVTGDHVLGLRVVLADGRLLETGRRQPKGVAGYDLTSLLVGSEGTLGVIVGLRLRLLPRPREVLAALAPFPNVRAAARAVEATTLAGLRPRALELADGATLRRTADEGLDAGPDAGALLIVEFDGEPGEPERALARFGEVAAPLRLEPVVGDAAREALWRRRYATSQLVKRGAVGWSTQDVAVPLGSLAELVDALPGIGERHRVEVLAYGHAGDGNLHVNILWGEGGAARGGAAAETLLEAVLALGGTISAEHGIGLVRRAWLPREVGPVGMDVLHAVKRALDPRGILNPGKVLS